LGTHQSDTRSFDAPVGRSFRRPVDTGLARRSHARATAARVDFSPMNRRFRLLAALGMAVVLATFMLYVGIKGGDVQEPLLQASELVSKHEVAEHERVQVDGIAARPTSGQQGEHFTFHVTDRDGRHKTKVDYRGAVPDAFRVGRNVIVTGKLVTDPKSGERVFHADPGSLVTKCPSKFQSDGGTSRSGS
jgi:cytochrome c-type biogenesis protein CcmE